MSKASSRPTSGSSLSSRRRVSIFPLGHLERLARVRFLTLPFSRQPSRARMNRSGNPPWRPGNSSFPAREDEAIQWKNDDER